MDPRRPRPTSDSERDPDQAVLTQVTCRWDREPAAEVTAVVLHAARDLLILETDVESRRLPPIGTEVEILGATEPLHGQLAEHGRNGRFMVCIADRPVRRSPRLRVSLAATVRAAGLAQPRGVELVDLTTGGARVRGVELPVHSPVTLHFTPPGQQQPISVRGTVAHSTHNASQPWIGVTFRLVAMRGGR